MIFVSKVMSWIKKLQPKENHNKSAWVAFEDGFTNNDLANMIPNSDVLEEYNIISHEHALFVSNFGTEFGKFLSYIDAEAKERLLAITKMITSTKFDVTSEITNEFLLPELNLNMNRVTCMIIVPREHRFALGDIYDGTYSENFKCVLGGAPPTSLVLAFVKSDYIKAIQDLRLSWQGNGSDHAKRFKAFQISEYSDGTLDLEGNIIQKEFWLVFAAVHELKYDIFLMV